MCNSLSHCCVQAGTAMDLRPMYFSAADDQWCGHPPLSASVFPLAMLHLSPSPSPTAPQQSDIWQLGGAGPLTLRLLPLLHLLHPLQWCHLCWTTSEHHHLRSQRESHLFGCSLVEILSISLSLEFIVQIQLFVKLFGWLYWNIMTKTLLSVYCGALVVTYSSGLVSSAAVPKSYVLGFPLLSKTFTLESTY